jgi:hypothetical protein
LILLHEDFDSAAQRSAVFGPGRWL